MPLIVYKKRKFRADMLAKIEKANTIIEEFRQQGFDLTLRQLYYQFVARDFIPNKQKEYHKLGSLISRARRAGLIDWDSIVDRTRFLRGLSSWSSPQSIIDSCALQFRLDRWANQKVYVEVWFEKDALMGVFERTAHELRLNYFSCRGYTSDSEIWGAAQRLERIAQHKDVVVLHFGDHDPSGLDMTRDIDERLALFGFGQFADVRRLALNMDQVVQYEPPPNPAKESDSRFAEYQNLYGDESWELDALSPTVLDQLIRDEIAGLINKQQWEKDKHEEAVARARLGKVARSWTDIIKKYDVDPRTIKVKRDDWSSRSDEDL